MTLEWILGWWNLIFIAPFVVALLYLGVTTISGIGMGDSADLHTDVDADADAHVAVDADADTDVDGDVDADTDAHADVHGDHDSHAVGEQSFYALALSWLGVGRVPLSLLLIVFMLIWGVAGFVTNAMMVPRSGWDAGKISLPLALVCSVLVTRSVVMLMGRYMPLNETSAQPRRALVGRVGEALFTIDQSFGMAILRDANASLQQVACRVGQGVEPIEKGRVVKLVAYNANEKFFFVADVDRANSSNSSQSPSPGR